MLKKIIIDLTVDPIKGISNISTTATILFKITNYENLV
jgi:hypothetical protein